MGVEVPCSNPSREPTGVTAADVGRLRAELRLPPRRGSVEQEAEVSFTGLPRVDDELARLDAESESRRDSDFEWETLNLKLSTELSSDERFLHDSGGPTYIRISEPRKRIF